MSERSDKLSTSALAKQLEVPLQQLFATLKDYGWIRKLEDGWALTAKGEFEGGEYRHSPRYGRYIVWPGSLAEHPLIHALENNRMLSAGAIGAPYQLAGKTVNRALAELGWLQRGFHGWELTARGRRLGGVQLENKQTDMLYVLWPEGTREEPALQRLLEYCRTVVATPEGDLFAPDEDFPSLDGHRFSCRALLQICHWLYLAGVVHASQRRLPVEEELYADFYLPLDHVYIDYWRPDDDRQSLTARMRRAEVYRELELRAIEIHPEELEQLDEVLSRQLVRFGVRFR
jgi:hypothetical protein